MSEELKQNISFDRQIEETEIEKKLSIPAKRLMEKLEPIPSKSEFLKYRWFWELVQNASDFNDKVDIIVEETENQLIFKHNGQPFKLVDVENLITPDSDKDDNEIDKDYIGRFGSGFISTHVLSSSIDIKGIAKDKYKDNVYHQFNFNLDRSNYDNKLKLIDSIKESEKQFKSNHQVEAHIPGTFETSFTYNLTKGLANINPKEISKFGVDNAKKVLPFVLTFLPKLNSIKFITNYNSRIESTFFQKKRDVSKGILNVGVIVNDTTQEEIVIHYAEHESTTVAVQIKDNLVMEYPENMSVLFLVLPMIGSEKFPFPVIINSNKFKPESERNAINISNVDLDNRVILKNGVFAFNKLLLSLSEDKIGNLYHLVKIKSDQIKALQNSEWYQENIEKEFKKTLENIELINCNGLYQSYLNLKIPFIPENKTESKDIEFYDIVCDLIKNQVPNRAEYPFWLKNIDFTIFKKVPFRLEAAVKIVEETKSIGSLSKLLDKSPIDTTNWLARFINYIILNENGLLTRYSIIPNKSPEGRFLNRDVDIFVDNGVDVNLIEIYNKMKNQDYNDILLNDSINQKVSNLLPLNKVRNWGDIAKEIDDLFRIRWDDNQRLSKTEIEGLNLLVKWLKNKGFPNWPELSVHFPTFNNSYTSFFMESFDEEEKVKAITIRNSGKQDSLLKLAESDVTEDELNTVVERISDVKQIVEIISSGTNISKLTKLAELFPDGVPENIMDIAKEDARKKKEFNNLLKVGSKVEMLFIQTLDQYKTTSNKDKIIHAGGGAYDIRIFNPDTNKSFYIELKSCKYQNTEPINIAVSQAKRAVKELINQNFAIVIIERSADNEMNEEYIKNNTKYFKGPGEYLKSIGDSYDTIDDVSNTNKLIDLKMDFAEFKGLVNYSWLKEKIGNSGFEELLSDIKQTLSIK